MRTYLASNARSKKSFQRYEVFVIGTERIGVSHCWDFSAKITHQNLYVAFLADDTVMLSTSLAYLKPAKSSFGRLAGSIRHLEAKYPQDFFETARGDSFFAGAWFKQSDILPSKELCKRVESVSFHRSGNLSAAPYVLRVQTRSDKIEDGRLIFKHFDYLGLPRKSIKRVSPCQFEVTVGDVGDATWFYGSLHRLLSIGDETN